MPRLVYFTDRFPFSVEWQENELGVLANVFEHILVAPLLPLEGGKISLPVDLPSNVTVASPLFTLGFPAFKRFETVGGFTNRIDVHLAELWKTPASRGLQNLKRYVVCSNHGANILKNRYFQSEVMPHLRDACLYFFWGLGYAESLPFLSAKMQARSLVRFHGHDLYRDRHGGYIPYQRAIVKSAAVLAPVSEDGARYLGVAYPEEKEKILCRRLGCVSKGKARQSDDGVFRIVSCGLAGPVKRLHLIPHGLRMVRRPIEWTHIGDGVEMPRIREALTQLGPNVKVKLLGYVPAAEVSRIYDGAAFDLFLSVSASEGIPVSMMEALAAGIPILATSVGGVREIVDLMVGNLLPHDFSSELFAERIEHFASLDDASIAQLRKNCVERHALSFNSGRNAEIMAETLLQLAN